MDIEFIELEHRQNVMKLMEICGLDMKEAYELYIDSGYNFETAVNKRFNPVPVEPNPVPQYQQQYVPMIPNMNFFEAMPILQNQFSEDDDYKYTEYKKFMTSGQPFDKKYPVRKRESFFERILPTFFKSEENDPFKKALEKYIGKRVNLKNTVGNLSEVLEWSWKEKYPVLVMVLDFSLEHMEEVKRIFSDDMFVEQVLNQQFKLFGISAFEYDLEQELKVFFNFERDLNHFIVCRVNNIDEVEIMHRIPVSGSYEETKKKLKLVKSQCIQLEMEESNIAKQYQEERRGNFSYKRPRSVKENLKLKEDRKIRQQQQEEFFKACLPKKEELQKVIHDQTSYKSKEEAKSEFKEQKKAYKPEPQKQYLSQEKIRKTRQQKFSSLKKYSSGLSFKIRVPSGQNIIISVDGEQKVQYLFDYISFEPSDIGFSNDRARQFDIFIGFGGSERLKGKQNQQLKSLFEDSQVLIVRQTAE